MAGAVDSSGGAVSSDSPGYLASRRLLIRTRTKRMRSSRAMKTRSTINHVDWWMGVSTRLPATKRILRVKVRRKTRHRHKHTSLEKLENFHSMEALYPEYFQSIPRIYISIPQKTFPYYGIGQHYRIGLSSLFLQYSHTMNRQTGRHFYYLMWSSALSYVSWCTGTSLANGKKKTCKRLLLGSSIEYKSM